MQPTQSGLTPSSEDEEVSVVEVLIVLAKHKKMILGVTCTVAVLSAIVSLLLPSIYTGSARLLPPQQNQSTAALLLGQLSGFAGPAATSLGLKNPSEVYVGMLKSRTVADSIINRFDLKTVYGADTMIETRIELASNSNIVAGKDGLITIDFTDEDPKRAAAVANAYMEELDRLTQSLAVTEAAQRRLFFERQLKQAKEDLAEAEVQLKTTQEQTGLIKLDDQGKAIIEAVAALRAQIAAKEIELRSMRTFATEGNPEYLRTQQQLAGLHLELRKLDQARVPGRGDILLSTGRVPEAGLEFVRKYRDVKYYETIFELIAKQFEVAKIDEAKESAVLQVVDQAVVPDRRSKPKRRLIVTIATVCAAFLAVLWAFFVREAMEKVKGDPLKASRLAELKGYLKLP